MKRLSPVFLLSFVLFACQKDLSYQEKGATNQPANPVEVTTANDAAYYVRFKSGDETETMSFNTKALLSEAGSAKSLVLQASANESDVKKESIRLYLTFLSGTPTEGTYKQGDPEFKYLVSGAYNPSDESLTYSAGMNPATTLPLTITISEISNGVIKGSFKGAFYKHDLASGVTSPDYNNYTEGEFSLPIY